MKRLSTLGALPLLAMRGGGGVAAAPCGPSGR
jgi:hypothetical protein